MKFKTGDKVRTKAGCRIYGTPDLLIVVDPDKKWSTYDAVLCQKEDGTNRLFLQKNLYLAGEENET